MSYIKQMICSKCKTEHVPKSAPVNDGCGGRIDILLDIESLKEKLNKKLIKTRGNNPRKYLEFYPIFNPANFINS